VPLPDGVDVAEIQNGSEYLRAGSLLHIDYRWADRGPGGMETVMTDNPGRIVGLSDTMPAQATL